MFVLQPPCGRWGVYLRRLLLLGDACFAACGRPGRAWHLVLSSTSVGKNFGMPTRCLFGGGLFLRRTILFTRPQKRGGGLQLVGHVLLSAGGAVLVSRVLRDCACSGESGGVRRRTQTNALARRYRAFSATAAMLRHGGTALANVADNGALRRADSAGARLPVCAASWAATSA